MKYRTRVAELTLRRFLKVFPVVGVTGPRQSGKSTLLRHIFPEYTYLTFDDPKHRLAFNDDPEGFLQSKKNMSFLMKCSMFLTFSIISRCALMKHVWIMVISF